MSVSGAIGHRVGCGIDRGGIRKVIGVATSDGSPRK